MATTVLKTLLILVALTYREGICGERHQRITIDSTIVSPIKDPRHKGECGCTFATPTDGVTKPLFHNDASGTNTMDRAWMNIDGNDVELILTNTYRPKKRLRKGDRYTEVYSSKDIHVKVLFTIKSDCTSEGCESTDMDAVFTVQKGKRKQIVHATGWCGCG